MKNEELYLEYVKISWQLNMTTLKAMCPMLLVIEWIMKKTGKAAA